MWYINTMIIREYTHTQVNVFKEDKPLFNELLALMKSKGFKGNGGELFAMLVKEEAARQLAK